MIARTRSIVRSAAVSLALFALAACGGSDDPPNPSVRIAQETFNFETSVNATKGATVGILTGSVNGRIDPRFSVVGTPEPNPDPYPFKLSEGGAISVAAPLTAGTYTFQAQAASPGGKSRSSVADVIIVVTPIPEATISVLGGPFSIPEDAAAGAIIGTVWAAASNGAAVSFAESDPPSAEFDVSPAGEITLAAGVALDFEAQTAYEFEVSVNAAGAMEKTSSVRVAIVNVDENAISLPAQEMSIAEDATAGTTIGTIAALSSDGAAVVFAESNPISTLFDVSPAGEVSLAADASLNFEAASEHLLAVRATAADAPPAAFSLRIRVIEAPQDGTAARPWKVSTLGQLQRIATGFSNRYLVTRCFDITGCDGGKLSAAASLAAHYRQVADIDASPTATWNDDGTDTSVYEGFSPIGTFGGSYDGGGYLISGLVINRGSTDNVGLFAATGGSSVLENVALVGADVTGQNDTGVLVGYAQGTVRQSFASGRLQAGQDVGGLVGESTDAVEGSFAAVTANGKAPVGGLIGNAIGSVFGSFALGSVNINVGSFAGGLTGFMGGMLSHSFATGDVTGSGTGGLVGAINGGSVSDSYATGSADTGGLVGQGTASSSYRVADPSGGNTAGTLPAGSSGTREEQLTALRALACDQDDDGFVADTNDAIFEDDDSNTCATAGAEAFPWDFGTDDDLPVINGLVGGLDAEGQRRAVEFSLVDRAAVTGTITSPATSVEVTLSAPTVGREAGSILSYYWVLQRSAALSADDLRAREVIITATAAASYAVHLTVVERDAAGTIIAVYADEFTLTVN